mgnify:CR=1 FL=1
MGATHRSIKHLKLASIIEIQKQINYIFNEHEGGFKGHEGYQKDIKDITKIIVQELSSFQGHF